LQVGERLGGLGALLLQSRKIFARGVHLLLQIRQLTAGVGDGGEKLVAVARCALQLALHRGELVGRFLGLGVGGLQVPGLGAGFFLGARDGEARVGDLFVEVDSFWEAARAAVASDKAILASSACF
jgi:hypothetical protein